MTSYQDLSIYIHYPFCKSKCPYCDFNSHVKEKIDHQGFLNAYLKELEYFALSLKKRQIKTIFFGGGTPSLMPLDLADKILKKIAELWVIDKNCEITLEANPTSFEAAKFKEFRQMGINRLSIGIQALNDADLKFLGREHNSNEAITTIKAAQKIFDNYSFDLIYARAGQTLKAWQAELKQAIDLSTHHLSLYQLTIEKGTKFYSQYQKKEFILPNEDLAAEFYELTNQITSSKGLGLYEISNYAQNGYECKHNLVYWQGKDYLGVGAGAHSRIYLDDIKNRSALMMIHEPISWLNQVNKKGAGLQTNQEIEDQELLIEIIMMALRTKEGLSKEILNNHPQFSKKSLKEIFNMKKLSYLQKAEFIEITDEVLKIKEEKLILANQIILKITDSIQRNEFLKYDN
jgi:putative oxygen-independent coproporphyrinogen III oxidase